MIYPQMLLDIHDELIVDLFAGGGGASCDIELATIAAALVRAQVPELIARDDAARWTSARKRVGAYA